MNYIEIEPQLTETLQAVADSTPMVTYRYGDEYDDCYLVPGFGTLFDLGPHVGALIGVHGGDSTCILLDCEDCADADAHSSDAGDGCIAEDFCAACDSAVAPASAWRLFSAAVTQGDIFNDDCTTADFEDVTKYMSAHLPPIAIRFLEMSSEADAGWWLSRFVASVRGIALRLSAGQIPYPRCTSEAMALHMCLELNEFTRDIDLGFPDDITPVSDDVEDAQLALCLEWLFDDHDVLLLFDPSMDGIESSDMGTSLGLENLHPRDWFKPFLNVSGDACSDLAAIFGGAVGV